MVLDASVALSWLLEDAGAAQEYATQVFDFLAGEGAEARVPAIWGLEVANVIAKCEARGVISSERSQLFLAAIAAAPIVCDQETYARTMTDILALARRHRLSSYDAAYLELSLRSTLPLATLDRDLRRAAGQANVPLVECRTGAL